MIVMICWVHNLIQSPCCFGEKDKENGFVGATEGKTEHLCLMFVYVFCFVYIYICKEFGSVHLLMTV